MNHLLHLTTASALFAATLLPTAEAAVGDLYVTSNAVSETNGAITRITAEGTVTTVAAGLNRPYGLAIDMFGNLYTSTIGTGTITKVTQQGVVTTFATGLTSPRGMAFDPAGNLFVGTGSTLTKVTPDGTISTVDSGFATAWDVTFDSAGVMYVDDLNFKRIYKYDAQGQKSILATLSDSGGAYGIALTAANDVIVTRGSPGAITRVTAGGVQSPFTSSAPTQPVGIDINSSGEVFVASFGNVFKYSADGQTQTLYADSLTFTGMIAIQTVPEPSALLLLALAGGGLALRRVRVR